MHGKLIHEEGRAVGRHRPELPLGSGVNAPGANAPAATGRTKTEQRLVLLVEDDPQVSQIFKVLMQRLAVEVACADCAEEGWMLARTLLPPVIVTDIYLPGLSGLRLIEMLRADPSTNDIPIFAWSGNPDYRVPALQAGANDFLSKPEETMRLIKCLGEFFEQIA